jgi:adenylate kinase
MGLNVIMLGPPGAGKGTQAERLAKRLGVPRISTGDILREAVSAGSDLGRQVQAAMSRGELVGDALIVEVVRERVSRPDAGAGFVLDGFPRTIAQAEALEALLDGRGAPAVVELVVPEDELVRRLSARRVCAGCGVNAWAADTACATCGGRLVQRDDDTAEVVRERLRVFARQTQPLVAFYRDRGGYRPIDGTRTPDEVTAEVTRIVTEHRS